MSAPGLTTEAQMRYLLQWFGEFSELQREDFGPILAAARGGHPEHLAATLASLSCQDKPVSLFQCRIKLFNEWYPTWSEEEQDRLVKGVTEIDPEFGSKFQELLTSEPKTNGTSEIYSPDEDENKDTTEAEIVETAPQNAEANVETPVAQDNIHVEIAAAS